MTQAMRDYMRGEGMRESEDFSSVGLQASPVSPSRVPEPGPADPSFRCAARNSYPEPQDCDWPHCGCDERASRVVGTLIEEGWGPPGAAGRLIAKAQRILRDGNSHPDTRIMDALDALAEDGSQYAAGTREVRVAEGAERPNPKPSAPNQKAQP